MPKPSDDAAPQQLSLFADAPPPVPVVPPRFPPPLRGAAAPGPAAAPPATALPDRRPDPSPAVSFPPTGFHHPRAQREAMLDGHRIGYEFRRARRRSIGFVVGPEGLTVSAPRWVGQADVDSALREKATWILRKLHEQRERGRRLEQARVEWRDGTTIPFLGETVTVVLDSRTTGAVLNTPVGTLPGVPALTLHVGLPQGAAPEQLREAVQSWLQRQARRVFEERCALFASRLGVRVRRLTLSSASTRWGSASVDGSIRLNWRLVHFAMPVIDYVVAHELAHLREMNHSDAFWDVVRSVMPDYEHARGTLRSEVLPVFD